MFEDHPYLKEIKTNVFHIPERLKEYDPELLIVRNMRKHRFEIHSNEQKGNTHVMTIPFNELDTRTLTHVRNHDLRTRGIKIIEEMDKHNKDIEVRQEKEYKNWVKDVVKETRWHFKKAYDEG